ncbi:hypothetical protein HBI15_188310 [Parastagonospora nodorum]|nr:hypothetical protein HBI15_188310 [Parastagonospora nodorum]
MHIYAADGLSSTITVYNYIKKDKNADLAIADSISDALDMCEVLFQTYDKRLAGELAIAESVTAKDPNYVDTFGLDFNILLLIAFIISYCLFADKLWNIQQSLLDRVTVVLIIILVDKTQLLLILGDRLTPSTLLARFIPTTKIRDLLLKTLENAAKSRILLICVDRRTRQCYLTICAILKYYNFNIYVSLATDTLHLLLKDLVIKMLDFIIEQKAIIQQLIAVSYDEDTLAYIQGALERINLILGIQPYSIKLPLSEVAANIAISDFIYAAALYLILIIIDYTCYDKDRKYIAYIRAFSKVLLFNNNEQIDNTTRMLSFYDLSTIIRLVHLVLRDLPNLTTYTTISYYVNNYID